MSEAAVLPKTRGVDLGDGYRAERLKDAWVLWRTSGLTPLIMASYPFDANDSDSRQRAWQQLYRACELSQREGD